MNRFTETQRFRQLWLWMLILLTVITSGYALFQQLYLGIPFGNNPASDTLLVVIFVFCLLMVSLIASLKLETHISEEGIRYRFFPFHWKYHVLRWEDIEKVYVREYSPIKEYGGWGIRWSPKHGKAYNVSGKVGIQLEMKNKKNILIGTQKPDEIKLILEQIETQHLLN